MRGWGTSYPSSTTESSGLFYLHEVRSDPKPGTAWNLVTTKDLIQFQDQGVSLPHGTDADLDFNAYTGSIVVDESGVHHLFYTGQNPNNLGTDGLPLQLVMHATSTDGMRTWVKHPSSRSAHRTATSPATGGTPSFSATKPPASGGCSLQPGTPKGPSAAAASSPSAPPKT
jgi:sucrose-6-phosphate hydrolase SacC (GH32 family)